LCWVSFARLWAARVNAISFPRRTLPFGELSQLAGVVVDGFGDVFVTDSDNNRALEPPAGAASASHQMTLPFTGLNDSFGVVVDGSGDVVAADSLHDRLVEPAGRSRSGNRKSAGPGPSWNLARLP
jgi:serine/threonine-protein kinase